MPLQICALKHACTLLRLKRTTRATHPEVNLQIPRTSKFPISDLKCDRHLIILMQNLVEAFLLMGAQLDVVSHGGCQEAQQGEEDWEAH